MCCIHFFVLLLAVANGTYSGSKSDDVEVNQLVHELQLHRPSSPVRSFSPLKAKLSNNNLNLRPAFEDDDEMSTCHDDDDDGMNLHVPQTPFGCYVDRFLSNRSSTGSAEFSSTEIGSNTKIDRPPMPRCLGEEGQAVDYAKPVDCALTSASMDHYQDFMQPAPHDDPLVMQPDKVLFFEPIDELRTQLGIVLIQAVGPLLANAKGGFEVLPCWLRTGPIVFLYRVIDDTRWLPVLRYGSTDDLIPFRPNLTDLDVDASAAPFADMAVLEKAAWEVYALSLGNQWPAFGSFTNCKVLFAIYGLKDPAPNLDCRIKVSRTRSSTHFVALEGNKKVPKPWFVPHRNPPSTRTSLTSTAKRGLGLLNSYLSPSAPPSKGIIKAGSTIDCFPAVAVDLKDLLNHCLLIVDHSHVDRKLAVFKEMFGAFMARTVNPLMEREARNTLIGDVQEAGLATRGLAEYTVDLHATVADWSGLAPDDAAHFGIQRHPLADIIPLLQNAKMIKGANPAGAGVLIARAVHRMAVLVSDCRQHRVDWMEHAEGQEAVSLEAEKMCNVHVTSVMLPHGVPMQAHHILQAFIGKTLF